jgi:hypothetical protein
VTLRARLRVIWWIHDAPLRTIRDKTGFHYDKLNLDQAVAAVARVVFGAV